MTTITIERAVLLRALEALRPATAPNGAKRDAAFEELRAALAAPATAPDELERIRKDAERYRFIRDADRSDCIWREICIYAMETLDEYVDAAMDGEATMKGTP